MVLLFSRTQQIIKCKWAGAGIFTAVLLVSSLTLTPNFLKPNSNLLLHKSTSCDCTCHCTYILVSLLGTLSIFILDPSSRYLSPHRFDYTLVGKSVPQQKWYRHAILFVQRMMYIMHNVEMNDERNEAKMRGCEMSSKYERYYPVLNMYLGTVSTIHKTIHNGIVMKGFA